MAGFFRTASDASMACEPPQYLRLFILIMMTFSNATTELGYGLLRKCWARIETLIVA